MLILCHLSGPVGAPGDHSRLTVGLTSYAFEADEVPDARCLAVAVVFVDADEGYIRIGGGHPLEGKTDDGGGVETDAIFEKHQFLFPQCCL